MPTRESVAALQFEHRVLLIHTAVPRDREMELHELFASLRVWALRSKTGAVATPYERIDGE